MEEPKSNSSSRDYNPMEELKRRRHRRRHVPPEIVNEILLRLPVKSLNRFRCVSSEWQSLISSSDFVREHLRRYSSKKPTFIVDDMVGLDDDNDNLFYWLPFSASSDSIEDITESKDSYRLPIASLQDMSEQRFRWPRVLASCDGMLCVCVSNRIYIGNPCMNSFRLVSQTSSSNGFGFGWIAECNRLAFGYDSVGDDYKLIIFSSSRTWVYSLKNNSWRRVEDLPIPQSYIDRKCYTFLNGRVYWLVHFHNSENMMKFAFFCFDLSEDKYTNMNMSFSNVPVSGCSWKGVRISGLQGMISVCYHNQENDCVDLWVMKDCTNEDSWTRILSLPFKLVYSTSMWNFDALYLFEDGEVLVQVVRNWPQGTTEILICKDSGILLRKTISLAMLSRTYAHVDSLIYISGNWEASHKV